MPDHKTYWAIIDDVPTECELRDTIHGGTLCIVHPLDECEECTIPLRYDCVFDTKEGCIEESLKILRRYYKDGEEDIKKRQALQASLFFTIQELEKDLEECHAGK